MWLVWSLSETIISGFTAIAIKKCSNNDTKRISFTGLVLYHLLMIIYAICISPNTILSINIKDMITMLPGVTLQAIGFFCAIASIKYGKVAITSSIKKCKVIIPFILGILFLGEKCTLLQLVLSIILVVLAVLISKPESSEHIEKDKDKAERKAILSIWLRKQKHRDTKALQRTVLDSTILVFF